LNFLLLPLALSYSSADGEPKREENELTVGMVMACLMLEVVEELRVMPFERRGFRNRAESTQELLVQ
jgi:hypothetical protein